MAVDAEIWVLIVVDTVRGMVLCMGMVAVQTSELVSTAMTLFTATLIDRGTATSLIYRLLLQKRVISPIRIGSNEDRPTRLVFRTGG